jgi:hypothetical protein
MAKDAILHSHRRENLKSYLILVICMRVIHFHPSCVILQHIRPERKQWKAWEMDKQESLCNMMKLGAE